jgi:hypothetical protein
VNCCDIHLTSISAHETNFSFQQYIRTAIHIAERNEVAADYLRTMTTIQIYDIFFQFQHLLQRTIQWVTASFLIENDHLITMFIYCIYYAAQFEVNLLSREEAGVFAT